MTPLEVDTQANGFWIRDHLIWQINGEFISDRALRSWVFHNTEHSYLKHVGPCILKRHVDAYALRAIATENTDV
jgi:hypothetical protein